MRFFFFKFSLRSQNAFFIMISIIYLQFIIIFYFSSLKWKYDQLKPVNTQKRMKFTKIKIYVREPQVKMIIIVLTKIHYINTYSDILIGLDVIELLFCRRQTFRKSMSNYREWYLKCWLLKPGKTKIPFGIYIIYLCIPINFDRILLPASIDGVPKIIGSDFKMKLYTSSF